MSYNFNPLIYFFPVRDVHGNSDFLKIKTENTKLPNYGHVPLRYFLYQHAKYVWVPHQEVFGTLDLLIPPQTVDSYINNTDGLFYTDYVDL